MKQSLFNFYYKRKSNENVLYNTFSKALVVLNDTEYAQYESGLIRNGNTEEQLAQNGILIDDSFDELGFLKYFHYKSKFSNEILYLTIAPTLDCNFACPYCYENRRAGKMSPEIQDAVIAYINDAVFNGIKKLDISWYGGEPLMYPDIVESLARRIKIIAEENGCLLSMHMVTNGYLLTEKIVAMLDEVGVTKIQITLDGLKEHHDVRRPLKSGKGTFDRIMKNLGLFNDSPIEVKIRMNIDNQNCGDYKFLKEELKELNNPNIDLYASPVEDINKDTVNNVSDFMTTEQFDDFTAKACREGSLSREDMSIMDDRFCFCTAETENCYVVDDQGDFYKCWDEVGRREYCCFNILDSDNVNYPILTEYLVHDPFSDKKCRECVYLPLCFGGCKFQKRHLKKTTCGFNEKMLRDYLETTFFHGN